MQFSGWVAGGFIAAAAVAAAAFIGVVWGANALLSPRKPNAEKNAAFECGLDPEGDALVRPTLRFGSIALLFVLFDAEAVLMFAVVSRIRGSWIGFAEVGVFVALLSLGLWYAYRTGSLEWRS